MHIFGEKTLIFVQILCPYEKKKDCQHNLYQHSPADRL